MPQLCIGISGWTYAPWRGRFYPEGLAHRRELEFASRQVNSIEINGTFYSLQTPDSFRKWRAETPDDFVFSVKGGRYITHLKRLRDVEIPLANFFASGLLLLGPKLGPILWQLPPNLKFDPDRLAAFFELLPRDTKEAAALARRHDDWMRDRAWTKAEADRPLRHALEVRHESFRTPEFIRLLRKHRIALVVADTAGRWPLMEDVTADFIYVRLHGDEELYVSGYTSDALAHWTRRVRAWNSGGTPEGARLTAPPLRPRKTGRDVFVYFDNDVKVRAPFDAMSLAYRLGIGPKPAEGPGAGEIPAVIPRAWPSVRRKKPAQPRRRSQPAGAA